MKKIISIILILIYLPTIGESYLWFLVKKYGIHQEVRQTIREGLKDEDLALIVVSPGNNQGIFWIEKGKEFFYKWEMYDLVKTKVIDGKTYYYCLNDTKEKQLISNYKKTHESKRNQDKNLKRILNPAYFPQCLVILFHHGITNHIFAGLSLYYKSIISNIPSPPPKQPDVT